MNFQEARKLVQEARKAGLIIDPSPDKAAKIQAPVPPKPYTGQLAKCTYCGTMRPVRQRCPNCGTLNGTLRG